MASGDPIEINISGSGPYGFRLSGGEGQPLVVNKLRKQSKACSAGLNEGDVLLGINGYRCQTMGHAAAMSLLENTVDLLQLIVLRSNDRSTLDSAYYQTSSRLRPLSPGSLPPPLKLPPPPVAGAGSLVIDQPTYLRRLWSPNVAVKAPAPQEEQSIEATPAAALESTAPKYSATAEYQPHDGQRDREPTFRVATISAASKPWSPGEHRVDGPPPAARARPVSAAAVVRGSFGEPPQPTANGTTDGHDQPQFRVSRNVTFNTHGYDDGKPWMWHPTEKYAVIRMHADVPDLDPEPEVERPSSVPANFHQDRSAGHGGWRDNVDGRHGMGSGEDGQVEVIPKWALPLRSEYDWRQAYFWMDPEGDDWEITDDGQYVIRKKKIFTDSSFYDDPQHRYPTIEEQIKMARKVAQSLTAAGNVKARGQRMFMRRKEKADRWTIDSFIAPTRRGGATPFAARLQQQHQQQDAAASDSEGEMLYYNPEPWKSDGPAPWMKKHVQVPAARPSTEPAAMPLTWKPGPIPSATASFAPRTPDPPMHREKFDHGGGGGGIGGRGSSGKQTGKLPPSVAFGLARDMRQMKDKGGRMFGKRRAKAAAEEKETDNEATRQEIMSRITSGYMMAQEETDGGAAVGQRVQGGAAAPAAAAGGEMSGEPSASRLLELIERTRGTTSYERQQPWADDSKPQLRGNQTTSVKTVDFTSQQKGAGFRPVRFQAPFATTVDYDDVSPAGISEF